MSKFKNGLTVDYATDDPIRRPRPVSQEGYYYPPEAPELQEEYQQTSRRQQFTPMRQYGSSASLEVHREHNQEQKEREFFSSSSNIPSGHIPPPGHPPAGHESFVSSRAASIMSAGSYDYDFTDYYYSDRMSHVSQVSNLTNAGAGRDTLSPQNSTRPVSPPPPQFRSAPRYLSPPDANNYSSSSPGYLSPIYTNNHTSSSSFASTSPNSANSTYLSSSPQSFQSTHISSAPDSPGSPKDEVSPFIVPDPSSNNNPSHPRYTPQYATQPFPTRDVYTASNRPISTESLVDSFVNPAQGRSTKPQFEQSNTSLKMPDNQQARQQSRKNNFPPQNPQNPSQDRQHQPPHHIQPPARSDSLRSHLPQRSIQPGTARPRQENKASGSSQQIAADEPVSLEDYVQQAIKLHEENQLEKSNRYFRIAAEKGSPAAMVLYGISLRHGWGCKVDAALAFKYLQKAAESAVGDPAKLQQIVNMPAAKGELVLAIYELGVCFRHGWGVPKNKTTAAYYFEIAANLGDPDAQNDIGLCYYKGEGVKKDMKLAAKYYRLAHAQGHGTMGNSWIFKEKYNV